ncbi:hypothetical protein CFP56_037441 [Quercus suber]|uniref:RNase H type-1 domain-containing protein n=1 Tax=Quercus suber TaxID=58331 RepID=A0AAW0LRJ1_QUESU
MMSFGDGNFGSGICSNSLRRTTTRANLPFGSVIPPTFAGKHLSQVGVKIEHYFREANGAVDSLAKYGCSRAEPFIVFSQPPFVVLEALLLDPYTDPISTSSTVEQARRKAHNDHVFVADRNSASFSTGKANCQQHINMDSKTLSNSKSLQTAMFV